MSKQAELDGESTEARYEYRVWGKHRKARKLLSTLASEKIVEKISDCYFLVEDPGWNAKVRDSTLKVKKLVAEERGFERWTSNWHRAAETAPAPFDDLFEDLRLDRPGRGKSFDLSKAVGRLDSDNAATAVFVTKRRTRYRVGSMRAEATDVTITDMTEVLHTLAIEGDDLDELVALRKKLGLKGSANVAMHVAIDAEG
jgi:propanediol dehydratase small subunit